MEISKAPIEVSVVTDILHSKADCFKLSFWVITNILQCIQKWIHLLFRIFRNFEWISFIVPWISIRFAQYTLSHKNEVKKYSIIVDRKIKRARNQICYIMIPTRGQVSFQIILPDINKFECQSTIIISNNCVSCQCFILIWYY